jgi:hypothetical protein
MQIAALAAVLTGASVGLAGPAYADPLSGSYTATVVSSMGYRGDTTATWVFTPCGPDCVRVNAQNAELHPQDGGWGGTFKYTTNHPAKWLSARDKYRRRFRLAIFVLNPQAWSWPTN